MRHQGNVLFVVALLDMLLVINSAILISYSDDRKISQAEFQLENAETLEYNIEAR